MTADSRCARSCNVVTENQRKLLQIGLCLGRQGTPGEVSFVACRFRVAGRNEA